MATYAQYDANKEIDIFFTQTTATRTECENKARQMTNSSRIEQVAVPGACSYSIYAGDSLEFVVQFRIRSLTLRMETFSLVTSIYGHLVPKVSFHGIVGDDGDGAESGTSKEPSHVFLMSRIPGITQLDFILAHDSPKGSPDPFRKNFMNGVAQLVPNFPASLVTPLTVGAASFLSPGFLPNKLTQSIETS